MLPPAPELIVEPLVEVRGHVLHVGEVCVVEQVQLSKHIILCDLAQLSQNLPDKSKRLLHFRRNLSGQNAGVKAAITQPFKKMTPI
jgi:hypothetical protein